MPRMRSLILWCLVFISLARAEAKLQKNVEYPRISQVVGEVQVRSESAENFQKAKIKTVLFERALMKVGDKSLARLELSPYANILVYEML